MKTLGQYIESKRESKGLSRAELGAAAGIQAGTIRKIETGAIKTPPPQRLADIAAALGIKAATLIKYLG